MAFEVIDGYLLLAELTAGLGAGLCFRTYATSGAAGACAAIAACVAIVAGTIAVGTISPGIANISVSVAGVVGYLLAPAVIGNGAGLAGQLLRRTYLRVLALMTRANAPSPKA